ncbi:hypothetical protein ACIQ9M_34785 [Streptomyces californicus]|uniref:hypothetical protein n=1 Tax=Streptomyces californicus TaxID=67351 RepID=UPI0005BC0F19
MFVTDVSAWIGLVGALGGAALTALAGVYGPSFLKRKERSQQELDGRRQVTDAAIRALVEARLATRRWQDYLEQVAASASTGSQVDPEDFSQESARLGDEAMRTCFALSAHGIRRVTTQDHRWILGSLRRASARIHDALLGNAFITGSWPDAVLQALNEAERSRVFFRALLDHMIEERFGPDRPAV